MAAVPGAWLGAKSIPILACELPLTGDAYLGRRLDLVRHLAHEPKAELLGDSQARLIGFVVMDFDMRDLCSREGGVGQ